MFLWTHQDSRGLALASEQATERCYAGAWGVDPIAQSSGSRVEDLLALIAESFVIRQQLIDVGDAGALGQLAPIANRLTLSVNVGSAPDVDHQNAQFILLRTWEALARAQGWTDASAAQLSASTGRLDPNKQVQSDVVVIVAVVVGIAALAALLAFVVWNVNTIIDRELARRDQARELMRAHADCQLMLQKHADAEKAAGHAIPFTVPELQVMVRLAKLQDEAMQTWHGTLAAPPPAPAPTQVAENVLSLAVVLGFLYLLFRREI